MLETWVPSLDLEDSPGEGNGNSLQDSCLGNPMDRRVWWASVPGVAKSWTRLSDWTKRILDTNIRVLKYSLSIWYLGLLNENEIILNLAGTSEVMQATVSLLSMYGSLRKIFDYCESYPNVGNDWCDLVLLLSSLLHFSHVWGPKNIISLAFQCNNTDMVQPPS